MGRLTLNVLLSFAQFEREVAGERIRDKIALSKRRGMWMGGLPPLGYDGIDRKLVVNEAEADTVRLIFRRYLEVGSVAAAQALLDGGIVSKRRTSGWPNGGGDPSAAAPSTRSCATASIAARSLSGRDPSRQPRRHHRRELWDRFSRVC